MSDISDLGLDLENLFQPAWAQGKTESNRFEEFAGGEEVRTGRRHSQRHENAGGELRSPRPRRKKSDRKRPVRGSDSKAPRASEEKPLPDLRVTFLPDEKGAESIARQIKMTGRAYPLFDIARLVLQKPERYAIRLEVKKKPDGTVVQPLWVCALDDTPWLSEDEVVAHVLKHHFALFYQADRTPCEPPKGKYTFVAQCGLSGVILGPPNHHDYQNRLRKLHAERFPQMPFEVFKSRVKIVKDEAVVKKWIEEQSFKTEYTCLNVPDPLKLPNLDEVEKHFRATHREAIVKPVETLTLDGAKSRNLRSPGLNRLVRAEWERQKHFPLQVATELSRQLAARGLQFFKVNKTVVHVSVARPQFLDLETTPVSENVKRIIGYINANPKCTRRQLIEALAPSPTVLEIKPEGPAAEPTPEQTALIADLHWLIHQGHVLEFADGHLETAKKPAPKPQKKPAEEKAEEEGEAAPAEAVASDVPAIESSSGPANGAEKPLPQSSASLEPAAPAPEAAATDGVPSPS